MVVLTQDGSVESASRAVRCRVVDYLPKPATAHGLLAAVEAAIQGGRVARLRAKLFAARFGAQEWSEGALVCEKTFVEALDRVRVVFQPIVRAGDGSVYGYEALLRCEQSVLSSPEQFLAAAELHGRVEEVGRAVRQFVASACALHRDRMECLFVNVHPSELSLGVLDSATEPLLPLARRVVLEVTERAALTAGATLDANLRRLRDRGFRIAVDDLGEGYSGLSSLITTRPEFAKIDMSLIRDIHLTPLKQDIVVALVDIARRGGITLVAEGVETVAERDVVVELGVDLIQGYLIAKPGPAFPEPRWPAVGVHGAAQGGP